MKNIKLLSTVVITAVLLVLASSEVIGSVFGAGMEFVIFIVVLISIIMMPLLMQSGKK